MLESMGDIIFCSDPTKKDDSLQKIMTKRAAHIQRKFMWALSKAKGSIFFPWQVDNSTTIIVVLWKRRGPFTFIYIFQLLVFPRMIIFCFLFLSSISSPLVQWIHPLLSINLFIDVPPFLCQSHSFQFCYLSIPLFVYFYSSLRAPQSFILFYDYILKISDLHLRIFRYYSTLIDKLFVCNQSEIFD